MATVYANNAGQILRFLQNEAEEQAFGAPPGAVATVRFDETTNQDLVTAINVAWGEF